MQVIDQVETEIATRASQLTFEELQLLFLGLAKNADRSQFSETGELVSNAIKSQLLLSELRPAVLGNFPSMDHQSFLATYQTYLYSGLFREKANTSSELGPKYEKSQVITQDDYD